MKYSKIKKSHNALILFLLILFMTSTTKLIYAGAGKSKEKQNEYASGLMRTNPQNLNIDIPRYPLQYDQQGNLCPHTDLADYERTIANPKFAMSIIDACKEGDGVLVQNYINFYPKSINYADNSENGVTPLMQAAKYGHLSIVKMLIDNGAKVKKKTNSGHTARLLASSSGHSAIVEMLIAHGAN